MVSLRNKMQAALRGMGRSHEQVAAYLAKRRVKGYRHVPTCCPIANYLKWALSTEDTIIVDGWSAIARRSHVLLSKAQAEFVRVFDEGKYPKLVK